MSEAAAEEETPTTETPAAEKASEENIDLLGSEEPAAEQPAPETPTAEEQPEAVETYGDGSWKDAEGNVHPPAPKDGDRPEWLPEKFKTPEDMAEAYRNLEKKQSERPDHKVPEKYEVEVPEALGGELDEEDVAFFKDAGFTNDQAQKFLTWLSDAAVPEIRAATTEAQMERLGRSWDMDPQSESFKKRMGELRGWAQENLDPEVVKSLRRSADGVHAMFRMMEQGLTAGAPAGSGGSQATTLTQAQIDSMVADPRYQTDEAYRQEVERKVKEANGAK